MTADNECLSHGHPNDSTEENLPEESVDEFKHHLYQMQEARRRIVLSILNGEAARENEVDVLREALSLLKDSRTNAGDMRHMTSASQSFSIKIHDEVVGLQKDILFLESISSPPSSHLTVEDALSRVDLPKILAPHHPISPAAFQQELENTIKFLNAVLSNTPEVNPIFITDWDGTMKNYCSQYATNLQPVYSAVGMAQFARTFTRLSAVLTAGPLRGPGILDLTALPIEGPTVPIIFSGSWGREWWLAGKRVVYDDGISEEQLDALERLSDEMRSLLTEGEYSQFGLVGSGVQRKVDRLTLGVQTVCNQVEQELSTRYQEAVEERMHRVDPNKQTLMFDRSTDLEVEVCLHSSGGIWNKADGVSRLIEATGESLSQGTVLIAGDTGSDVPMVEQALAENKEGTFALFVSQNATLAERVHGLVADRRRVCIISCPDVFHAALAAILVGKNELD